MSSALQIARQMLQSKHIETAEKVTHITETSQILNRFITNPITRKKITPCKVQIMREILKTGFQTY